MSIASYYDDIAAGYSEQYQRERLMSHPTYPANFFRLEMIIRRLQETGSTSIYDIGAGEGSPLVAAHRSGLRVAGCDIAPAMVEAARANFSAAGLDPDLICLADGDDPSSLQAHLDQFGQFDAVMALGVIPHVPDDVRFIDSMSMFTRPGGRIFLEFRNTMFSLYTLNRPTKEFYLDELLVDVPDEIRAVVEDELDRRLAVDKPPKRVGTGGKLGYDEILSRFHNPFELADTVRSCGYHDIQFHWYHYHPAPPMLEAAIGKEAYRSAAFDMEHEGTWRGMFLCSAGVIEAVRNAE
jgi:2-polyprenyl-3-methyl-5-hydroxy-6-metoxy-1,4-benzoquinol methylase